jgi:CCR4-NOT transcriptional regulation complex NOT5 subunit
MTDQHRATPEQWEHVQISAGMKQQIPWATADCILELRSRIEALEAAQLEQAESNRFCVDAIVRRVEALEAKPAAWRPLETEITYGNEAAADAVQILRAPMVVQGTFEHGGETYQFKAKPERESAMTELRAASAEARPAAGLVDMVEEAIITGMVDSDRQAARAAIRDVATWLDIKGQHGCSLWLREEANHG